MYQLTWGSWVPAHVAFYPVVYTVENDALYLIVVVNLCSVVWVVYTIWIKSENSHWTWSKKEEGEEEKELFHLATPYCRILNHIAYDTLYIIVGISHAAC